MHCNMHGAIQAVLTKLVYTAHSLNGLLKQDVFILISLYFAGVKAKALITEARKNVAKMIGAAENGKIPQISDSDIEDLVIHYNL